MSRIRVKLATAAMLAGTAVGATLVTATPASAVTAPTAPCPANNYCLGSNDLTSQALEATLNGPQGSSQRPTHTRPQTGSRSNDVS